MVEQVGSTQSEEGKFCMNIWLIEMKSSTLGSWNGFAVIVWKKGLT